MTTINDFYDHIYCINLDRRLDRWKEVRQEFKKHGIENVERFSAVDGVKVDREGYSPYMKPGDIGSLLTHINLFKDAQKNGYKNFLMLEDDVEFVENLQEEFSAGIKDVPEHWDILYLGGNHARGWPITITNRISIAVATLSTHAVSFKDSCYEQFLQLLNKNEPNDVTYCNNQRMFNSFVFLPPLAWQRPSWSDVNNVYTDYDFLRIGR